MPSLANQSVLGRPSRRLLIINRPATKTLTITGGISLQHGSDLICMQRLLCTVLLVLGCLASGQAQLDSLLNVLDTELDKRGTYLTERNALLTSLDQQRKSAATLEEQFNITLRKVAALESFSYTRASKEVLQLKNLAAQSGDSGKIAQAIIRESFINLSAGLFHDAVDSLNTLEVDQFPPLLKTDYLSTRARAHLDLANNYVIPELSQRYRNRAIADLDSAIVTAKDDPFQVLILRSNRAMAIPAPREGIGIYHQIKGHPKAGTRLMAKEHAAAGEQYARLNLQDSARLAFVKSAIADERTVTREIVSLVRVARDAYEREDFERSARYIDIGLENANFFDARHRKIEVLEILPLIEEERLQLLNTQRRQFIIFSSLLGLLLVLALVLIRQTIKQNRELKERRAALQDAMQQLARNNDTLRESQKIKEQYIGYFFQTNTKLINSAKTIIDKATKAVYAADFKEAKYQLKSFNAKQQNKQLLQDFDRAFLTLFPNFVERFQELFPQDIIWQEDGQDDLSTEVRIFALMRLGIRNNEVIARILGYSVNTIYAYRSKVRGKSPLENDDFDAAVMSISSEK